MENLETYDDDMDTPQPLLKKMSSRKTQEQQEPEVLDENQLLQKLEDIKKQMNGEDIDESMIDPIFFNVMEDPVVISSGLVMDRSTFFDKAGNQKIHTCPTTRKNLEPKAYPLIFMKKKLVDWRLSLFDSCIQIAEKLDGEKKEFNEACEIAEEILKCLGDSVYIQKARRLAKALLKQNIESPMKLAQVYIRIYKTLTNEQDKQNFKDEECNKLFKSLRQKLDDKDLQGANEYLEACEYLQANSIQMPKLNYIKLELAKINNNPVQIFDIQCAIYHEMLDSGCMPAIAFNFLLEEGIENKEMIPLNPIIIKIKQLNRSESNDDFHLIQQTGNLKFVPRQIQIKMKWNDQGWGNQKGEFKVSLMRKEQLIVQNQPFGIAPHESQKVEYIFNYDTEIVKKYQQGDHYRFSYKVGGGGGHSLKIQDLHIVITPNPGSTTKPIIIDKAIGDNDDDNNSYNSE